MNTHVRIAAFAVGAVLGLGYPAPAIADPFGPFEQYAAVEGSSVMAIADFNSDGLNDVLVKDRSRGDLELFTGDGSGALTRHPIAGGDAYGIAADVTSDGIPDVVAVAYGGLPQGAWVQQRIADGAGGFADRTSALLASGNLMGSAGAVGDFTGDGKADVAFMATPYGQAQRLFVAPGDGNGGYAPVTCNPELSAANVYALPDLNGDIAADLALATSAGLTPASASLALSDGAGCFGGLHTLPGSLGSNVEAADMDGDGAPELLYGDGTANCITVARVDASGDVHASGCYPTEVKPVQLHAGDGNDDGIPDVAYGAYEYQSQYVGLLGGDDAGGLDGGSALIYAPPSVFDFGLGLLNADSKPDLVVASAMSTISVAMNTTAPRAQLFPEQLDFGSATVGSSSPAQEVILADVGESPFDVVSATLGGTAASSFAITSNDCESVRLYPGWGCSLSVAMRPAQPGTLSATVTFGDGAIGEKHVLQLAGTGVDETGAGTTQAPTPPAITPPAQAVGGVKLAPACRVPRLKGLKLAVAKKKLRRAHCGVGTVRFRKTSRSLRGRVVASRPKAGSRLKRGSRVAMTVGRLHP